MLCTVQPALAACAHALPVVDRCRESLLYFLQYSKNQSHLNDFNMAKPNKKGPVKNALYLLC